MYKNIKMFDPDTWIELDFHHMMATISGLYYKRNFIYEYGGEIDDLAGWLGDLRTLASDIYKKLNKSGDLTREKVIEETKKAILNPNPNSSSFSYVDLLADVDAVNIEKLMATMSLSAALSLYYESGYNTRFSSFVKNVFGSLDAAYNTAYFYLDKQDGINPPIIAFDNHFDVVYDKKIAPWIAEGFKQVLAELIAKEGG